MVGPGFAEFVKQERAGRSESQGSGGFFGGLGAAAGAGASAFRSIVPQEARDVGGFVLNNALSGERFLNTAGGFLVDNDQFGTGIADSLDAIPHVGGLLRVGFDVATSPLTIATAGFGGVAATALRTSRLGIAGKLAALAIEPITGSTASSGLARFGQRYTAENLLGTGAAAIGMEINERLPEGTPSPLRLGLTLGGAALGGSQALRAARSKAPWLVGREVLIDQGATMAKLDLDRLATRHDLSDMIPARTADDVIGDASARVSFGRKYRESESGTMRAIARTVMPADPGAQALLQQLRVRQQAADSYRAARVQNVEFNMTPFDIDAAGRVTNLGPGGVPTPAQKAAMEEIGGYVKEAKVYLEATGVKFAEVTGEEIDKVRHATKMEAQPMFGDMFERHMGEGSGAFFPRVVTEVGGIDVTKQRLDPTRVRARQPGFAEIPEHIATMEENMARGVRYQGQPPQILNDYFQAVLAKGDAQWLRNTANSERFGARTVGAYIDEHAPGIRAQIVSESHAIRGLREKLARQVATKTERGRAARNSRRQILLARRADKSITKVQAEELANIDLVEAARRRAINLQQDAKGFRQTKTALNRPVAKAISNSEDGIERLDAARDTLREIDDLSQMALDARVLSEADIAATKLDVSVKRNRLGRAREVVRELREVASHPLAGEGAVPKLGNTFFPQEFADAMNKGLTPDRNAVSSAIGGFNNAARAFMATMDLSAAGIQGLLTLGTHPIQASRAIGRATASLMNPEWYNGFIRAEAASVDGLIRLGGKWASNDDMGEFLFSTGLTRIPKLGWLMNKSNMAFSRTGNLLRLQLFKSAMETSRLKGFGSTGALTRGVTEGEGRKVVSLINSATGFHGGKPATWESMALFAPRFFKSQLDVITRAVAKGGPDADLARLMLFRTMALGGALTIAANEMRGKETEFNPIRVNEDGEMSFNSNFMRIMDVGGQDVSVFGAWDSLLGLMTTTAVAGPMPGATRLFRTKASPVLSTIIDIIEGETFNGQKVDVMSLDGLLNAIVTETVNKAPFTVQDFSEGLARGDGPLVAGRSAGFNFFGLKSAPTTLFEDRDQLATSMFDRHWSELTGKERDTVEAARPQLFEDIRERDEERGGLGDPISIARTQREKIDDSRIDEEAALSGLLQTGQITIRQLDDRMKVLQASSADQKQIVDDTLGLSFDGASADPNQQALSDWYDLREQAKLSGTDIFDFELFEGLEAAFMAGLNDEQRRFVEERSRPEHAPEIAWYYTAKDIVAQAGYYDTVDAAYKQLAGAIRTVDPTINSYSSLLAAIEAAGRAGSIAVQAHLEALKNAVDNTAGAQKQLLRVGNPALDQALLTLGRVSTPVR